MRRYQRHGTARIGKVVHVLVVVVLRRWLVVLLLLLLVVVMLVLRMVRVVLRGRTGIVGQSLSRPACGGWREGVSRRTSASERR